MIMYNSFKIAITLLSLVGANGLDDYSRNFCQDNPGLDNFSCWSSEVGGVDCFSREELCNNSPFCDEGEDEGTGGLQCKQSQIATILISYWLAQKGMDWLQWNL